MVGSKGGGSEEEEGEEEGEEERGAHVFDPLSLGGWLLATRVVVFWSFSWSSIFNFFKIPFSRIRTWGLGYKSLFAPSKHGVLVALTRFFLLLFRRLFLKQKRMGKSLFLALFLVFAIVATSGLPSTFFIIDLRL